MNDAKFMDLIKRYQINQTTEKESILIDNWLDKRGKENIFNLLPKETQKEIKERILRRLLRNIYWDIKIDHQHYTRPWVFQTAAVILLLAASTCLLWQWIYIDQPVTKTVELKTSGSIKKVLLADGSIVWLKEHSSLTYPDSFTGIERNVRLTGNALFEIAKDPWHPFILHCGELKAKVLGTSFNIKTTDQNIELIVFTGKVAVSLADDKQNIVVRPHEKALYNGDFKKIKKMAAREKESTQEMAGTSYAMQFYDVRMQEVISRIEDKFDVTVVAENAALYECLLTIDLTDQSLKNTLLLISSILAIQYQQQDHTIVLKGGGCH